MRFSSGNDLSGITRLQRTLITIQTIPPNSRSNRSSAAPDAYEIETPDSNIDFRRVGNLNVYFSRHAQSLTTDLNDIKSWQGGDIVVFGTHVAIVSDKRNSKGIPYILHLVSPTQKAYEQDGMEHWEKKAGIMGHYRMGQ